MKKLLIIALFAIGCTKKNDVVIAPNPAPTYNCIVKDSIVYKYRTCANSTRFDTSNLFIQPIDIHQSFSGVSTHFMDSVTSNTLIETKVLDMGWLYCDNNTSHDRLDTLTIYKRYSIK